MSWINDDNSKELNKASLEHERKFLNKRAKLKRHTKEIKSFLKNLNWFEFQELLELWARHVSKKQDISISATSLMNAWDDGCRL